MFIYEAQRDALYFALRRSVDMLAEIVNSLARYSLRTMWEQTLLKIWNTAWCNHTMTDGIYLAAL